MLMEELARKSTYFCEKAGAGGFLNVHLATVLYWTSFGTTEVSVDCNLQKPVLFIFYRNLPKLDTAHP